MQQEKNHPPDDYQGDDEPDDSGQDFEDDIYGNGSDKNDNERLHRGILLLIQRCRAREKYDTILSVMACEGTPII